MQALRLIKNTNLDGEVLIKLPKSFGHKVEIIVFPVKEVDGKAAEGKKDFADEMDEALFLASSFAAVTEDDVEEDEVWRKYL